MKDMRRAWPYRRILLPLVSCLVAVSFAGTAGLRAESTNVLVAYHSETGHTEKMAKGVAAGAGSVEGTKVVLRRISDVTKDDLLRADAIVLGSPVHMWDVAVEMRTAVVNWSRDFGFYKNKQLADKVGAVFATGGAPSHGKEFTMMSMSLSLLQFGMVLVAPYGGLGASATTAVPESDKGVDERELGEARRLGERVARMAARLKQTR